MPTIDDKEMIRLARERFKTPEEFAQWMEIRFPTETPFYGSPKKRPDSCSEWTTDALDR